MSRKNVSIGLSIFGGFLGFLFGFGALYFCNLGWAFLPIVCVYLSYIGGVSLFAIVGALIEFKSLIVGSIICLISGVLGIIFAIMIAMTLPYPNLFLFIFFLIIVGGALV